MSPSLPLEHVLSELDELSQACLRNEHSLAQYDTVLFSRRNDSILLVRERKLHIILDEINALVEAQELLNNSNDSDTPQSFLPDYLAQLETELRVSEENFNVMDVLHDQRHRVMLDRLAKVRNGYSRLLKVLPARHHSTSNQDNAQ